MRRLLTTLAAGLMLALSAPAAKAQAPATLKGDLLKSLNEIEQKMSGLATALSEAQYDWRPGEGVRSVREVLLHVAADNVLQRCGREEIFLPQPQLLPRRRRVCRIKHAADRFGA